jgi:DNA-binding IscR family transcriptional regulator
MRPTSVRRQLQDVWVATRSALRDVLDHVSLADIVGDQLPAQVRRLVDARRLGPA